jgi:hypothetical protein
VRFVDSMCAGHWWGFICKWGVPACKSIFTRSVSEFFFVRTDAPRNTSPMYTYDDRLNFASFCHMYPEFWPSGPARSVRTQQLHSQAEEGFEKSTIFHSLKHYMVHCLNDKVVGKPKKDPTRVHPKWCLFDSLWMFRVDDADVFHSRLAGVFSWTAFNYSIRVKQLQTKHLLPSKL